MEKIRDKLSEKGLKITPQRFAILEAVTGLNHPTADDIIKFIKKTHPNIATGTVYKVLDKFVETGLIKRITTERDVIRYDGFVAPHHHMYGSESQQIEDYVDEELDEILRNYFNKVRIENFDIEEISLQIKGKFKK